MARTLLTADATYYFNGQSGSDSNDGATPATAFATLQHAWDYLTGILDLGGYKLTLQNSAPSNFVYANAGLKTFRHFVGQGDPADVRIDGNGATFNQADGTYAFMGGDNVTARPALLTWFRIQNMKIQASNGGAINVNGSTIIVWQDVTFGPVTTCHMNAINAGGSIIADGNYIPGDPNNRKYGYTLAGGAAVHAAGLSGGMVVVHNMQVTIAVACAFSVVFIQGAYPAGEAYFEFTNFLNYSLVTGKQFDAQMGGMVSIVGMGSPVPGNIAGTADSYGIIQS